MGLSKQMWVTLGIEGILVLITLFLLTEPGGIWSNRNPSLRMALRAGGMLFLCIMFCWSFILGCLIALEKINLQG